MHPQQPKFKLNRNAILIGLISATFPVTAYCIPAGRIDFVSGRIGQHPAQHLRRDGPARRPPSRDRAAGRRWRSFPRARAASVRSARRARSLAFPRAIPARPR